MVRIAALYRYPLKGLSPEGLDSVALAAGDTFPGDRAYALEVGGPHFDSAAPRFLPKTRFLMLMRDEKLAALSTRFDPAGRRLTIERDGADVFSAALDTPDGARALERYLANYLGPALPGALRLVSAAGHSFSDVAMKCVSIINLATLRALEATWNLRLDPLRFRANIYVDDAPAWAERNWVGSQLAAGSLHLDVVQETSRCAATNVDPVTAARDMDIPRWLMRDFDHMTLGVYATVVEPGRLARGDGLDIV